MTHGHVGTHAAHSWSWGWDKTEHLTQDFIKAHEPCDSPVAVKQILHLVNTGGLHFQLRSGKEVGQSQYSR